MLPALVLGALISDAAAQGFTLERVVLVSRHGVRAPTDSPALVEFSRSRTWPKWPVRDAYLTLRGKMLASRMGEYYAAEFAARGLFPAGESLTEKQVYVWADVDQRTKETGAGLLEGIFACQDDCPSPGSDYGDNDALFHPVKGGVCDLDPDRARNRRSSIRPAVRLKRRLEPYRTIVRQLQDVLDCCQPKLCGGGWRIARWRRWRRKSKGHGDEPDRTDCRRLDRVGGLPARIRAGDVQGRVGSASRPDQINRF